MKNFSPRKNWLSIGLVTVLLLTACEDSYLMRKLRDSKEEKSPTVTANETPKQEIPKPSIPNEPPPEKTEGDSSPNIPDEPPPPASASLQDLINETNGYVGCINRTRGRTVQSKERYLSWVNEKTGPTCKERYISYGLYTLYADGIQKCKDAAERGAQSAPSLPEVEAAAQKLATAYETLVPLVQQAEDYYQQEDYKDDNCAKAKEMHPKLMAAFQNYLSAEAELSALLKPIKKDVSQKELARLEQEQGKKLPWHIKKYGISAELLMETVPENPKSKWDSQAYLKSFELVEADYQALQSYLQANPDEEKSILMFSMFSSRSKDFYTQAKLLKRELVAGKADPRTVNKFISEYNELVQNSNTLNFR